MLDFDDRPERDELGFIQNPSAPTLKEELESFINDLTRVIESNLND